MALVTGCRTCWLAGLFFSPVAIDAHLVHDLLGLQLALGLQGLDCAGGLREKMVTNIAIAGSGLVPLVREGHVTPGTAVKIDLIGSLVGSGKRQWNRQADTQYKNQGQFKFHCRSPVFYKHGP